MKNKITVFFVSIMLMTTTILIIPSDSIKADGQGENGDIELDFDYIYNITYKLSNIIHILYDEENGELAKGRAFGTKGEWDAAEKLAHEMEYNLSLYDPTETTYPNESYLERLKNIESKKFDREMFKGGVNLTDKLEVLAKGITIHNNTGQPETTQLVDFFISPRWNLTGWTKNFDELTYNFTHNDLQVIHRPYCIWDWICSVICYRKDAILENVSNENITNTTDMMEYLTSLLEQNYSFSFEDLEQNPENITNLSWYDDYNSSTRCGDPVDFVFIEENPVSNPNKKVPDYYNIFDRGFIRDKIDSIIPYLEMYLWLLSNYCPCTSNCTGLVRFDHNKDTYDMDLHLYKALPIL